MSGNGHVHSSLGDRPWDHRAAWVLFAVLGYFPVFYNLDVMPLRQWDEARQAISAYEMVQNGNWLVSHFYGAPDLWSTKPPLLIWCQALLMKLLGPGELAVRLPASTSAFLTGVLLMWVCARWLRKPWLGLAATLVLFTSEGFLYYHVARHGDYDAPMTFFMLLQAVALFRFSMNGSRNAIAIFFFALAAGVLTKSIQSLMFLPGLGIFLLISGAWKPLLRQRTTWIGLALAVGVVTAFYVAREQSAPGYIAAVVKNELGDRYNTVVEGHVGDWDLYLDRFVRWNFTHFYLLVPIGLALGVTFKKGLLRSWAVLVSVVGVSYLAVISSSSTKCHWYDAPSYPMIAMLAAFVLHAVFHWLMETRPLADSARSNVLPFAFFFLVFAVPYKTVLDKVYYSHEWEWDRDFYAPAYYFKEVLASKRELKADVLSNDCYDAQLKFYMFLLNERGLHIQGVSKHDLQPGMRVMAFEQYAKQVIERDYRFDLIEEWRNVKVYSIHGPSSIPTDTIPAGQ